MIRGGSGVATLVAYAVFGAVLGALGWYLWTAHQQHLPAILFYALALVCPLMHFAGHGKHRHADEHPNRRNAG